MKNHTITLAEAKAYEFEHPMAASYGKGEHKELRVIIKNGVVHYEVYSHREQIDNTASLKRAVEAYNDAR